MLKKILIIDDHLVVRTGISIIIEENIKGTKLYKAANFHDGLSHLKENYFELIILDINLPGGTNREMIHELRNLQPEVKILMFSVNKYADYAAQYILAGANGYLDKLSNEETIVTAIRSILQNNNYFTPDIINAIVNSTKENKKLNPLDSLSKREIEIAKLFIKGDGNLEVANKLNLSVSTISTYKSRIFEKLNIKNLVNLIEIFEKSN